MIGYVYKIESDCKSICYIGSTTRKNLNIRFKEHKSKSKSKSKNSKCTISRYLIDSNYMFSNGCELLKSYEICDKQHLLAYEQLYINKYKCINEYATFKLGSKLKRREYLASNRDHMLYWQKQHYKNNKDKIKAKHKKYREQNKDTIKQKSKEYREQNKDKEKERHKKYRELNKDKISSKIICSCKSIYRYNDKARHLRTKKHISFLASIKTA